MTLSKERVEELENGAIPTPGETLKLVSAYRTREAAIAECEAGRLKNPFDWCMNDSDSCSCAYHVKEAENWAALLAARAATDAARREEGQ